MFEVAQFDGFSYLFNKPTFINLDPAWVPGSIAIQGLRIGINGKEALAGQAYANLDVTVDAVSYDPALGQELSPLGTVIALEKGSTSDEFFLTFELFAGVSNTFTDIQPSVPGDPADPAAPVASDIGVRTFEEINSTIAAITGVPVTNGQVQNVYNDYIQQLPSVEDISAFLPSHQMAIAQLAMTSCSELVEGNGSIPRAAYFPGFDFGAVETSAFDTPAKRGLVIDPLLTAAMNVNIANAADNLLTQPDQGEASDLLGAAAPAPIEAGYPAYNSLIDEVLAAPCNPPFCVANSTSRTRQVVKAVCAVATGGAVMLVQ